MKQHEVYTYIDENMKKDECILSVDFYFDGDVSVDDAVDFIDDLIEADIITRPPGIQFNGHRPSIYAKSPYAEDTA